MDESFAWAEKTYPAVSPGAWCGDCGYTVKQSVIEIGRASFCLACHAFSEHSNVGRCDWCGETVTGPLGDRISPGCVRCAYHLGFDDGNEPAPEYLYDVKQRRENRALRERGYL